MYSTVHPCNETVQDNTVSINFLKKNDMKRTLVEFYGNFFNNLLYLHTIIESNRMCSYELNAV